MELLNYYASLVNISLCFQVTLIRTMDKEIYLLNNSTFCPCKRHEGRQTKVEEGLGLSSKAYSHYFVYSEVQSKVLQ